MNKKIRYFIEAIPIYGFYYLFKAMPIDAASATGGFIGRKLGMKLGKTKTARNNLKNVFPHLSHEEIENIIVNMWDNIGRNIGELPHIKNLKGKIFQERIKITNEEYVKSAFAENNAKFFISGHFGNWEILSKYFTEYGHGKPVIIYRKANNPFVEKLIYKIRSQYPAEMLQKGKKGAKEIIKAVMQKKSIGMLLDQKQNDGIAVPFFGRDAMTAPAVASLALKYNCQIIMVNIIRKKGAYFEIVAMPPIDIKDTGNHTEDVYNIMLTINKYFEDFIRENPSQWFWIHNRWPKR